MLFRAVVVSGLALVLSGCCKTIDVENAPASAACKSSGAIGDPDGDVRCNKCCRAQGTTRGTVYGGGACSCYDGKTSYFAPAVSISTAIAIHDPSIPPTFRISGAADGVMFVVMGPFATADELRRSNVHGSPGKVGWSLTAVDRTAHARSFPLVRYGVTPKEFTERVGPAPPLVAGGFYIARVAGGELLVDGYYEALRDLCFEASAAAIVEIPCKSK